MFNVFIEVFNKIFFFTFHIFMQNMQKFYAKYMKYLALIFMRKRIGVNIHLDYE